MYVSIRIAIAPGYGEITDQLVSLNPLYLMDEDHDMFKEIREVGDNRNMQQRTETTILLIDQPR